METIYEQWKKTLEDFKNSVDKELNEVRRCKAEMQQIKLDIIDQFSKGQYFRDDQRIIISAPEIIIGDVNKDGTLKTIGTSTVIIRSNNICQEGVGNLKGEGGSITNKASEIRNICIDPGIDGKEEVVSNQSQYIVQAQGITLQSEDTKGVFAEVPSTSNGEISLKADKHIHLHALAPLKNHKERIEKTIQDKENIKKDLEKESPDQLTKVEESITDITTLLENGKKLFDGDKTIRSQYSDVGVLHNKIKNSSNELCQAINSYQETISKLAETNRQIKSLKEKKKDIEETEANEIDKGTGTSIDILAESTRIKSMNANNETCRNSGAGLDILAKNVKINSTNNEGAVMDESSLDILTHSINLSTVNPKHEKETSDLPAVGDVHITSKNIIMESVDYEYKDKKKSEKALTKDGCIKMRAETVDVSTNDTEGKATGKFNVNSKNISLKSMDVDKEKRTDKELSKDSYLALFSNSIYTGYSDKGTQTTDIWISSDKMGIFAKTTAEIQQDGAALQLDGGNIAISGNKTNVFGETTVNGKTTFKSDTISGKATIDNLEIKKSFKSPSTNEGIATPSSSSTDELVTKLKEEDAQKEKAESK